jgi:predicted regulator of Ras-like GTPase activity (Roadblock/LC7/MglB family)
VFGPRVANLRDRGDLGALGGSAGGRDRRRTGGGSMANAAENDLVSALEALKAGNRRIRSVFLSSTQGRFLGSTSLSGTEKVQMAGVSAASIAIASKSVSDLHLGALGQVRIMADGGSILLLSVGARAILTVLVDGDGDLGAFLPEAVRTVDRLQRLV